MLPSPLWHKVITVVDRFKYKTITVILKTTIDTNHSGANSFYVQYKYNEKAT